MLTYLLKASLIWLLLLIMYELLYARSRRFAANRIYLLATVVLGLLLPLIPVRIVTTNYFSNNKPVEHIGNSALQISSTSQNLTTGNVSHFNWSEILMGVYIAGIAVLILLTLWEVITIMSYAIYGQYKMVGSFKVFETGKQHQPFSFMGWIFITGKENYTGEQMEYIIRHENAHNRHKHWLDIVIMQIAVIVFWFHPLIWRIRYHLKMQHEYEADSIASENNPYSYGHFLLQAAVQSSAPLIAHSFFYSPIKNRINMLTKNQNKQNGWKYIAIIPAVFGCLIFLTSATNNSLQRIRVGDKTTFKGNDFYWTKETYDTVEMTDPITGEIGKKAIKYDSKIYKMNDEVVVNEDTKIIKPQSGNTNNSFIEYFGEKMGAIKNKIPDSISLIKINNIVLDKKGNIIYYDVLYSIYGKDKTSFTSNKILDPIIDNIINNSGKWQTEIKDGMPVNTFISEGWAYGPKPQTFQVTKINSIH